MASSVAGHKRAFGADTVPGCYEDLELADLVVLVGSQRRLVPSGALPAHRGRQGKRARTCRSSSSIRAAPRLRRRRSAPAASARAATSRCSTACSRICADATPSTARSSPRITTGCRSLRCAQATGQTVAQTAEICRPRRGRRGAVLRLVRQTPSRSSRSIRRASTSRRAAPTRSMRSSTAIWPPAASASPAWGRSRSPASPTPWAGAKSAAWPTCSPPTWTSRTRDIATACSASGSRRDIAAKPGLKAVDMFDAVADGASRRCGSWHQSGRSACRTPIACARALAACALVVVSDCVRRYRHRSRHAARAAAGARLGREGRHRHQFRAPHLAPAAHSCRRPARRRADWWIIWRSRAAHGLWRGSTIRTLPTIFREHARSLGFRE